MSLALWWSADVPQPLRQLRLSLVGPNSAAHSLVQGQPAYNTYPFHLWQTPAFVIDRQLFAIPDDLSDGDYAYRLELLDAQGQSLYTADLGPLTVTRTERLFELPPFATPVGATFGGEIDLPGYTLSPLETEFFPENSVSRGDNV